MAHRPFTDEAGYMRHCWECKHAKKWCKGLYNLDVAVCELSGTLVGKYYSPTNPCCRLPSGCNYERRGA